MSTEPKFSLRKKAIQIPIEQEDGTISTYEIRRASGTDIEAYLDENSDRIETTVDDKGRVQIKAVKTYKGMFTSLLKRCLYLDDKRLSEQDIAAFPYDVQKGLFDEAQTVNGLNEEGANKAKN